MILRSLNADVLKSHGCLFGGGTAIALRFGEYRESVDIDFMISDSNQYRDLRSLITGKDGLASIFNIDGYAGLIAPVRTDQYGIRSNIRLLDAEVKFEIVREGRICFDTDNHLNQICGVGALSTTDMMATKLLANSDRWADRGVFSRDLIDLSMIEISDQQLQAARAKAIEAYGEAVLRDVTKAVSLVESVPKYLQQCCLSMDISIPAAVVLMKVKQFENRLTSK
jgi:hypothetical protein